MWKPGGDDWKTKGDLGNLEQLSQLRYDLPQLEPVIEGAYPLVFHDLVFLVYLFCLA